MVKKRAQSTPARVAAEASASDHTLQSPPTSNAEGSVRLSKAESKLVRKQNRMRLRAAKKSSTKTSSRLFADAAHSVPEAVNATSIGNVAGKQTVEGTTSTTVKAAAAVRIHTNNPKTAKAIARVKSDTEAKRKKQQQLLKQKQRKRREAQRVLHRSKAQQRLESAQDEMALFDHITQVPAFVQDPFAALLAHLDTAMPTLQPQTPDLGRAMVNKEQVK